MIDGALEKILMDIDRLRSRIEDTPPIEVLELVQDLWIPYSPTPVARCVAGVDSGYNYDEVGGFVVFIVNAGSLSSCGGLVYSDAYADIYFPHHEPEKDLTGVSVKMELDAVRASLSSSDLVLVDGSLISKILFLVKYSASSVKPFIDPDACVGDLVDLVSKYSGRLVFVAKSSSSRELFRRYVSRGDVFMKPDIFYVERYTREPGYTRPERYLEDSSGVSPHLTYVRRRFGVEDLNIYFSYIRVEPNAPVYRVEVPVIGEISDLQGFFRDLADLFAGISIAGYPAVLREVDRLVRVGDGDIGKLKLILGIDDRLRGFSSPRVLGGGYSW